jgi:pimeloyl-ACP methyl ester carboxylesterase
MTSKACLISLVLFAGCSATPSAPDEDAIDPIASALESADVTLNVFLRGQASTLLHARLYANPRSRWGTNVLAVPGLFETGATFGPLARAIFADRGLGAAVKTVIALDLPGHGGSDFPLNLPGGVRFGDLTIEDNIAAIVQAIDRLEERGLAAHVIVAHSLGGLEVQAAQQALLDQGSSLAAKGVDEVLLLAPVPPLGQPWNPAPAGDSTPFIVGDAVRGSYLSLPPSLFIARAFATTAGILVAGTPTPAQVISAGYAGPEPLALALELVGAQVPQSTGAVITLSRPAVSPGVFGRRHDTDLAVIGFEQDLLVPARDLVELERYLTGDVRGRPWQPLFAADAVHSMHIANPAGLVEATRATWQRLFAQSGSDHHRPGESGEGHGR